MYICHDVDLISIGDLDGASLLVRVRMGKSYSRSCRIVCYEIGRASSHACSHERSESQTIRTEQMSLPCEGNNKGDRSEQC